MFTSLLLVMVMASAHKFRLANIVCISILLLLTGCMDELGDEGFSTSYVEYCASCHGENLEGTGIGPALIGRDLKHGETIEAGKESWLDFG